MSRTQAAKEGPQSSGPGAAAPRASRAARMTYLAIDPGADTGWALFSDRDHLVRCGLGDPSKQPPPPQAKSVVIEVPQIYNARNMKGNPNNIITLAVNVG